MLKIIINENTEVQNVDLVSEKKSNIDGENKMTLVISIRDIQKDVETIEEIFNNITSLSLVKIDEDKKKITFNYNKYNILNKVERKINSNSDITTVTLVKGV